MKILLMAAGIFLGQLNIFQEKPVVHLIPHRPSIPIDFRGKLLELISSPPIVYLPDSPPAADPKGEMWEVDVKNLGPHKVAVVDRATFSVSINVGETARIVSNGASYSRR
jgi:hypothetical protein